MKYKGILISGLPGSGKSTAAKQLAPLLGWPILYIGGLWREQWKQKYPNGEMSFENFMETISEQKHKEMDAYARDMLAKGSIIGDMWHEKIAEGLPILRVFISAPLEIRAQRAINTGRFDGKTIEEIKVLLQQREELQANEAKKIYGPDYNFRDPSIYHIALNSGLLTVEEKVNSLLHFFKS
ncbi:AAA family ATPase [Candidatus Uhrbacteria bacterium]|nr:AAA family ATPase [Candidatus Uhrbacteria bacterium]